MISSDESASSEDSRTQRATVSTVTENGFVIVRTCDLEGAAPSVPGKYCFVVQDSTGAEHDITVEFSRGATALVQRRRHDLLSAESSFWINCAERSLATYLWEEDRLPAGGELFIEEVCLNDLEVARRWGSD